MTTTAISAPVERSRSLIVKKGRDNGLLLLWAIHDRRVRVEVGYGLEDVVPDDKAGADSR